MSGASGVVETMTKLGAERTMMPSTAEAASAVPSLALMRLRAP